MSKWKVKGITLTVCVYCELCACLQLRQQQLVTFFNELQTLKEWKLLQRSLSKQSRCRRKRNVTFDKD